MNSRSPLPQSPGASNPRKFAVVTICHAGGYEKYGRVMVDTYLDHWPADVPLMLYTEGFDVTLSDPRLVARDLVASSPELVAFKARHRDDPRANGQDDRARFHPRIRLDRSGLHLRLTRRMAGYRWDAVRFAHKTFAIFHAARHTDADVLVWVDADTRFFADVDRAMLESFQPIDCLAGYLKRDSFSECGFVTYNLRHPGIVQFLREFEAMYTEDLLFDEHEFHDSWLFDVVRKRAERRGERLHDIGNGIGMRAEHVLINSVLGTFMDHMKGDRKDGGASHASDLIQPRNEDYGSKTQP